MYSLLHCVPRHHHHHTPILAIPTSADNGFYRIRAISYCLNDAPTFFPLITPNSRGATSITTQDEGDTQSDSGTTHGGSRKATRSRTRTLPFDAKLLNELEATLFTEVDEVDEVVGFQFKGIGDYIDAYKSGTCSPEGGRQTHNDMRTRPSTRPSTTHTMHNV